MRRWVHSLNGVHPEDRHANEDFQSMHGLSRTQLVSLAKSDHWKLIEKVVDRNLKERHDRERN
jgi:hypothetical protein